MDEGGRAIGTEDAAELRAAVEELRAALGLPPLVDGTFGTELRRLRKQRGISLRSLAGQVGVSPTYVSKIENAHLGSPSEAVVREIARALETDEWEFLLLARKLPSELVAALLELSADELREIFVNRVMRMEVS